MKKNLINIAKYLTLVLLFWVLFRMTKFYGDYCSSVYIIFIVPAILILILVNIAILYIIDFKRKKYKITNYVLLSLVALFSIHLLLNYVNSKKKIEQKFLVYNDFTPGTFRVNLYEDETYEVIALHSPEVDCHYTGRYSLNNDYLILDDDEISEKTKYQVSEKYKFNKEKQEYESLEEGFPNMKKEEN